MKVLVTGVAGFLGSRLTETLLETQCTVVGLDIVDKSAPKGLPQARIEPFLDNQHFSYIQVDVTDPKALTDVIVDTRPDAVTHLACRRDLDWAHASARLCIDLHVGGTATIVKACIEARVAQLLMGSSAHVYGASRTYPFSEDDPVDQPLSVLGASVRAAELTANAISNDTQLAVTVVRLFSLYGPGQSPRHLLPALALAAERKEPRPIYGDGTAGRDMLHVDDAVVALMSLLKQPRAFRVFNLGSGQTTTLAQVAELVSWIAGSKFQTKSLSLRPGEMPHTYADTHALQEAIGFKPAIGLEEGIRGFMEWHKSRPEIP